MGLHLLVLGAAAGGGLPQWNCACGNCHAVRSGLGSARSQSQLAVSANGSDWFLINASPDLRDQLYRTPFLHPDPQRGLRNTPVAGVLLTSADLDHILGLLLMREFTPVSIYGTSSVLSVLEASPFFSMLDRVSGQKRTQSIQPNVSLDLLEGLRITPIPLPGNFPAFVSAKMRTKLQLNEMTLGVLLESTAGVRAVYLPALPSWTADLRDLLVSCAVVIIDGTFWSEDELQCLQPGTPSASMMGHMPIGGPKGSLAHLAELSHVRRIYTHINNSNPILTDGSVEQWEVLKAGVEIAFDGMEIEI